MDDQQDFVDDAGFGFDEDEAMIGNTQALSLSWAFGFSKDVKRAVIDLSNDARRATFYLSAHTGVIYDYTGMQREQHHLQGHCNPITTCCHDMERRYVVTGDAGPADTLVVVWDSALATPIASIFDPHPYGVAGMDMSPDAQFIVTLSAPPPASSPEAATWVQEIAIWEWHADSETPRYKASVNLPTGSTDSLTCVRFNPTDVRQLITHSTDRVVFWQWHTAADGRAGSLTSFSPPVNSRDFGHSLGAFTDVTFLPPQKEFTAAANAVDESYDASVGAVALSAVASTRDGDLLLWEAKLGGDSAMPQIASWRATKLLNICRGSVMCLTVVAAGCPRPWLVAGCSDGAVRVYDYLFRVVSWFEKVDFSAITSLSFAMPTPAVRRAKIAEDAQSRGFKELDASFSCPAFVVGTSAAVIISLSASDANKTPVAPASTIGTVLAQGMATAPTSIVGHPSEPYLAIGTQGGNVHLWNLDQRRLVNLRKLAREEEIELKEALEDMKTSTRDFREARAGEAKAKARSKASKAKKRVVHARAAMQQLEVTACAYNATGTLLAVGTANGRLLLLHSATLEELGAHEVSTGFAITHIRFSRDGVFMATADTNRCVGVFRFKAGGAADDGGMGGRSDFEPQAGWVFIGKHRSHTEVVTDLQFSASGTKLDSNGNTIATVPLLASVGADRRVAVYDLNGCSISSGLQLHRLLSRGGSEVCPRMRVEDTAVPTAAIWTSVEGTSAPVLAVANDEFKIRMWGASAEEDGGAKSAFIDAQEEEGALGRSGSLLSSWRCKCRTTVLGSTHGGPIASMVPLDPSDTGDGSCVVFCSSDKVVGLARLPFTGNPNSMTGTVAHPTSISSLTVVKLGPSKRCVVTAGGADMSVLVWDVDTTVLDSAESMGGDGITPFLAMLNDSVTGAPPASGEATAYDELVDYVVYSQLQRQGEQCTSMRSANRVLPIGEVPQLFRAMGYYPSQWECELVASELELQLRKRKVQYAARQAEEKAKAAAGVPGFSTFHSTEAVPGVEEIPLVDLVRAFVNHRPLPSKGVTGGSIEAAFATIAPAGAESIVWEDLQQALTEEGEKVSSEELLACMQALVSQDVTVEDMFGEGGGGLIPREMTAKQFAASILGFA